MHRVSLPSALCSVRFQLMLKAFHRFRRDLRQLQQLIFGSGTAESVVWAFGVTSCLPNVFQELVHYACSTLKDMQAVETAANNRIQRERSLYFL